jgi:chromosome partitioning protein
VSTRFIAVMNQKGGVGKTTLTVNLGAALGILGKKVLLLDLDPQANLSIHLNVNIHELPCSIYEVLAGEKTFAEAVIPDLRPGVSLVPANIDLSGAEVELVNAVGRETLLRDAMVPFLEDHPFDFVFFDCPPSLGILSLNALSAAAEVFIPIQTEFFALQGLAKLLGVIDLIAKRLNPQLHLGRVVPTLYDVRTTLSKEVLDDIQAHFGDMVTKTLIRKNVRLAEAPSHGKTIFEYAATASGSRDFMDLAREVLNEAVQAPALETVIESVARQEAAEVAKAGETTEAAETGETVEPDPPPVEPDPPPAKPAKPAAKKKSRGKTAKKPALAADEVAAPEAAAAPAGAGRAVPAVMARASSGRVHRRRRPCCGFLSRNGRGLLKPYAPARRRARLFFMHRRVSRPRLRVHRAAFF